MSKATQVASIIWQEELNSHVVHQTLNWECSRLYIHRKLQGGSNMTGTDLYVNKPHCAAAVRP